VAAGATPRFADICPDSFCMDPLSAFNVVTKNTEAVMPVHFGGQVCDMQGILHTVGDLYVIEDSAETIGGEDMGKKAGSFGIGCFSFFPTKNMTTGEGGMITTDDERLALECRRFISHGIRRSGPWYRDAVVAGFNMRMSDIAAAIGIVQLGKIDEMNRKRKAVADLYRRELGDYLDIGLPSVWGGCKHVYQMYVIKVRAGIRDRVVEKLNENGIGASVHFCPPIHQQSFYTGIDKYTPIPLPVTEEVSKQVVSLPIYPDMVEGDVMRVIHAVKEAVSKWG
jgi:dTDP-4-amino-4,6-dideoxygalactose transaminase